MRLIKIVTLLLIQLPAKFIKFALFIARKSRLVVLVSLHGVHSFITFCWRIPILGIMVKIPTAKLAYLVQRIMMTLNKRDASIDSINLVHLAVRNMRYKRTRSFITLGGMAIGIGTIVFLVSLGYGTQRLVVSRVARLEELRQADITTRVGSSVRINDKQLQVIKDIQGVSQVLPLISVVGRVNYQNSVSDMVVYGVTADYLQLSAIRPIQGTIFKNNNIAKVVSYEDELLRGDVADATARSQTGKRGDIIGKVNYSIEPEQWIRLRADASINSRVVGYTRRMEGQAVGELILGDTYSDNAFGRIEVTDPQTQQTVTLGKWLKASFPVWEKRLCDPVNVGCDSSGLYMRQRESNGDFVQKEAYTALIRVSVTGNPISFESFGQVLGETNTTTSDIQTIDVSQIIATGKAKLLLSEIASESAALTQNVKMVNLGKQAVKQAVVNRAALSVLGIDEGRAIGQEFEVSFVVTGNLLTDSQSKIQSTPARYQIIGVVSEGDTPFFYVPFIDLRSLGIDNFTQAKLVSKSQAELGPVRQKIESLGLSTESVADTVDQIERLFSTLRMVLITVGMIALGVAALGMFNTLTVSLLERTHEVGLMKAMGMNSKEIEDLFLIESVAMGLFGGLAGVVLGFLAGKITSIALTILALRSGAGVIDVSDVPLSLIALVLGMSLTVGLLTGIYPARRAKKISALNALRYE